MLVWLLLIKNLIDNEEQSTAEELGSTALTNLDRLKAIHYLWISIFMIWIPWGLARLSFIVTSSPIFHVVLNDACRTIGYFTFVAIPLIYIKMDRRFSTYIKAKLTLENFRKKKVEQEPNAIIELT